MKGGKSSRSSSLSDNTLSPTQDEDEVSLMPAFLATTVGSTISVLVARATARAGEHGFESPACPCAKGGLDGAEFTVSKVLPLLKDEGRAWTMIMGDRCIQKAPQPSPVMYAVGAALPYTTAVGPSSGQLSCPSEEDRRKKSNAYSTDRYPTRVPHHPRRRPSCPPSVPGMLHST
ncbi:hypothetical protein DFH06DRAFT_1175931, partial [Mycena polygramma]